MEIKQGHNKFYVGDETESKAEIHFVPTGATKMIVDHTYVSDELRGQRVGEELVRALVEYAREQELKVIPLCPFTKLQFERHPEYHDVYAT